MRMFKSFYKLDFVLHIFFADHSLLHQFSSIFIACCFLYAFLYNRKPAPEKWKKKNWWVRTEWVLSERNTSPVDINFSLTRSKRSLAITVLSAFKMAGGLRNPTWPGWQKKLQESWSILLCNTMEWRFRGSFQRLTAVFVSWQFQTIVQRHSACLTRQNTLGF